MGGPTEPPLCKRDRRMNKQWLAVAIESNLEFRMDIKFVCALPVRHPVTCTTRSTFHRVTQWLYSETPLTWDR